MTSHPWRPTSGIRAATVVAATALIVLGCSPSAELGADRVPKVVPSPAVKDEVHAEPQAATDGGGALVIRGPLSEVDWKAHLGERVSIEGELVIVDTYDLMRWGEVKVARDRVYVPTNHIDPNDADPLANSSAGGGNVAAVTAAQRQNDRGVLILDDGFRDQNTFPPRLFPELGGSLPTVRTGSVIRGVSGELQERGKNVVLVPSAPLTWKPAERPERPLLGEAGVTVACFNVLNFFTALGDGESEARGANTHAELQRQQAKLVAAILAMQADVIGLMELENTSAAEAQLASALNRSLGADVFRGCGVPATFRSAPGGQDAIRVGLLYRSDRVVPVGDVGVIADEAFGLARAPLVQTFTATSSNRPFTVVVNHLKSKGGADDADQDNKDRGDGQGAYTAARKAQALALVAFVEELEKADEAARVLLIGDFNAYAQEDPIDALRAAGLVDLRERLGGAGEGGKQDDAPDVTQDYSYVYSGQSGTLDYAFGNEAMAVDVTGVATWHINADEPRALDYNQEYNPESLYRPDAFRSSDHDPVLIGIAD